MYMFIFIIFTFFFVTVYANGTDLRTVPIYEIRTRAVHGVIHLPLAHGTVLIWIMRYLSMKHSVYKYV